MTFSLAIILVFTAAAPAEPLDTKKLVEIAARYKLPMPPKEARLVWTHAGAWQVGPIYVPAFLLKENADGSILVLRGTEQKNLQRGSRREPLWKEISTQQVQSNAFGHASFQDHSAFICAV